MSRRISALCRKRLACRDESFDIGMDTRTPVDESYKPPFAFTGTIDKLTYEIRPEQLTTADRETFEHAVASARD